MGRSIGIDLGTTNTAVAVIEDGRPRILEDEKGYKVLPSCVSAKEEGRYIIGQAAKNLVLSAPERTVYAVKRLIGRRFDSDEVQNARRRMGYGIEEASDGGVLVRMGNEALTPSEICSIILQVARQIAERALDDEVEEAVITVPAYFTHAQRAATLEGARLAGLHCDRLINEPTAAALAYGHKKTMDRLLVIYDLGGGTFDICVLRLSSGVYEILATSGDSYLGGEDFDYRLMDHLADHFQGSHAVDLREDRTALQRLKDAAERAKCELSFTDRTTVLVPRILDTENLEMAVSRQTLEGLVDDLVARTIDLTRRTVADAGLKLGQVDDVVLVGGQTRMPKVREAITGLFGQEPSRSVHPEEVVAAGAAVHANTLEDTSATAPLLLDVTPFDLGIDTVGGMFSPVVGQNSKVPVSRTRTFATIHDNQDRVKVVVRQGVSGRSEENEFLGEFVMEGITPKPRMEARVEVTFRLDANGMLHVQAVEPGADEKKQITIRNYAEVARAAEEESRGVTADVDASRAESSTPPGVAPSSSTTDPAPASSAEGVAEVEPPLPPESTSEDPQSAGMAEPSGDNGGKRRLLSSLLGRFRKSPSEAPPPEAADAGPDASPETVRSEDFPPPEEPETAPAEPEPPEPPDEEPEEVLAEDLDAYDSIDDLEAFEGELVEEEPSAAHPPFSEVTASQSPDVSDVQLVNRGGAGGDASPAGLDFAPDDLRIDLTDVEPEPDADDDAAIHSLDDQEALVPIDGDDELEDEEPGRAAVGLAGEGSEAEGLFTVPENDDSPWETGDVAEDLEDLDDLSDLEGGDDPFLDADALPLPEDGIEDLADQTEVLTPLDDEPSSRSGGPQSLEDLEEPTDPDLGTATAPPAEEPRRTGDRPLPPLDDPPPTRSGRGESASPRRKGRKKPARLKMHYHSVEAFLADYSENLRRGGTFVRTPRPLPVGRHCTFEIHAPGLEEPLTFPGVVTWSSRERSLLEEGQEEGMGIEFQLDEDTRGAIDDVLGRLSQ